MYTRIYIYIYIYPGTKDGQTDMRTCRCADMQTQGQDVQMRRGRSSYLDAELQRYGGADTQTCTHSDGDVNMHRTQKYMHDDQTYTYIHADIHTRIHIGTQACRRGHTGTDLQDRVQGICPEHVAKSPGGDSVLVVKTNFEGNKVARE